MTTNDANQTSLLGDLAYKFGGAETTATEALGYILSRSDAADAARDALRDTIRLASSLRSPSRAPRWKPPAHRRSEA